MRTLMLLLLSSFLASVAVATNDEEAKHSKEAERTAKNMRGKILSEIKKLGDHEWAGEYYAGDGLGVNTYMVVAPKSGYVFEWHGCLGLYDRNYGTVAWTNNRVRLSFTFKNNREGFQGIAAELIPVVWGTRHYLIPADQIVRFCNDINSGREPRMNARGFYLLRKGDEKKQVTGQPKLPGEYQAYLLAKPIEAKIIAVGAYTTCPSVSDWRFKDTPVTLNAGAQHGLRVGMKLVVIEPGIVESVQITKVDENHSQGIMTQIGEDKAGPETGWRLSTEAPWNKSVRHSGE